MSNRKKIHLEVDGKSYTMNEVERLKLMLALLCPKHKWPFVLFIKAGFFNLIDYHIGNPHHTHKQM